MNALILCVSEIAIAHNMQKPGRLEAGFITNKGFRRGEERAHLIFLPSLLVMFAKRPAANCDTHGCIDFFGVEKSIRSLFNKPAFAEAVENI